MEEKVDKLFFAKDTPLSLFKYSSFLQKEILATVKMQRKATCLKTKIFATF
jgi:hypothetical protein